MKIPNSIQLIMPIGQRPKNLKNLHLCRWVGTGLVGSIISGCNFQFGEVLIGHKLVCRKAFLATASFTEIGNKMR